MKPELASLAATVILLAVIPGPGRTSGETGAAADPSLILWLPLDRDFSDHSSKKNRTGTVGDVRIVPGEGAVFDGDKDAIGLEALDLKDRSFSIALWMKVTGSHGSYGIFQQQSARARRHWLHFLLREPDKPYLGFYTADTKGKTSIRKTDGWRHIVCTWHEGTASIYLDGRLDASEKQPSFLGDQGQFLIGVTPRWNNVPLKDFEGVIRDFRVYTRALSEFEISVMATRR